MIYIYSPHLPPAPCHKHHNPGTAVLWHHAAAGGGGHADLSGHLRSHLRRAAVDRSLHVGELRDVENSLPWCRLMLNIP